MADWIKVEDFLPEPLEPVLIWYEYYHYTLGEIAPEYGIGYICDGRWRGDASYGIDARVIAWMPLPKPPKEVNNG